MPKLPGSLCRALLLAAFSGLACAVPALAADDQPSGAMLRYPDVSKDRICFVYANDIWTVAKTGGIASPLASPPGGESFPRFSPDGKTIAFVGNYDGNRDIYTLPLAGGIPTRVTHHPSAESLSDWTPDGKLLFLTNGMAGLARQTQLFTVDAEGGLPQQLPVPYGGYGAISPNGEWLAYTPHSTDTRTWKRYRGGMATDIWLFNIKTHESNKVTDWEGTDTIPMWVPGSNGNTLYYLSDNGPEHRLNIWSTTNNGKREQITKYKDDDVRWPSVGPGDDGKGEIVFQLGSEVRLLNLATGKDRVVNVTIPGAHPTLRARTIDAAKYISNASISPSGKRVAIEARGDVWTAPAKEGVIRNLSRTDGVFERMPAWSPDGRWIAYLSDESGEYELYIRASDGRAPTSAKKPGEDAKKPGDDAPKADKPGDGASPSDTPRRRRPRGSDAISADGTGFWQPEKKDEDAGHVGKAEPGDEGDKDTGDDDEKFIVSRLANITPPRKLTSFGPGFRFNPTWSPDSKHIVVTDKAGNAFLVEVTTDGEPGETKKIDTDPLGQQLSLSWSQDSNWLTYSRGDEDSRLGCIWVYNIKTGDKTRLTSPLFSSQSPTFDRKGDYLYFASNRAIEAPTYSDIDSTFAYTGTEQLFVVPLRKNMKSPFAIQSDEVEFKKEEPKDDAKKEDSKKEDGKKDGDAKPSDKSSDKSEDKKPAEPAKADDGVSGTWEGKALGSGENFPPEGLAFTMSLTLHQDGRLTGTLSNAMGSGSGEGTYDKATGTMTVAISVGEVVATLTGTIKGEELTGTWTAGTTSGNFTARRTAKAPSGTVDSKSSTKADKDKPVKIDTEGFERRAIQIPVPSGSFNSLTVESGGKLIYVRQGGRRVGEGASIKIFDINDEAKEEKQVTAGGGGIELSADGKKLLVARGSTIMVMDPAAGGGKSTTVPTAGMKTSIDPRAEWRQIFSDVWRLERDYFYEPTMHGVDWPKMREHYGAMIEDCTTREDVVWVISELISELNIGHAYVTGPGDIESQPSIAVGMLGCDYELVDDGGHKAYRISKIYEGGPWDVDARGPLSEPGVQIKEGDYLLAVNGVPVDTSEDPWAAFIDTASRATTVTVGKNPVIDEKSHDVLLRPLGGEQSLRTRAWIEKNRAYVAEKSGGKVGYIYVPNTGVDGQNELFRQFSGQRGMGALIIDERWNGGGQIPTRFIELLNRPVTNFWAIRDGKDWVWPPDSHQGPKCMLINGLAGSGGDAFPWYFKQAKIGPTIGTRTWGGLVGIGGYPQLIDGGSISVPRFAFYKKDGTWGVEGHGVDPDIEVIDDPAKMVDGGDPQLDRAIAEMEKELKDNPFIEPKRPASPDRSGMGIPKRDW